MTWTPPSGDALAAAMSMGDVEGARQASKQCLSEERDHYREALDAVLSWQVIRHPLPWRVESDWTEEVVAADGYCIAKCDTPEQAEAIVALASREQRVSPPSNSPQTPAPKETP